MHLIRCRVSKRGLETGRYGVVLHCLWCAGLVVSFLIKVMYFESRGLHDEVLHTPQRIPPVCVVEVVFGQVGVRLNCVLNRVHVFHQVNHLLNMLRERVS